MSVTVNVCRNLILPLVAELQDAFWEMLDLFFEHQTELTMPHILSYAQMLGLDMEGADLSEVSGTPTVFINGRRHFGAYGITELKGAVRAPHARSRIEWVMPMPKSTGGGNGI